MCFVFFLFCCGLFQKYLQDASPRFNGMRISCIDSQGSVNFGDALRDLQTRRLIKSNFILVRLLLFFVCGFMCCAALCACVVCLRVDKFATRTTMWLFSLLCAIRSLSLSLIHNHSHSHLLAHCSLPPSSVFGRHHR